MWSHSKTKIFNKQGLSFIFLSLLMLCLSSCMFYQDKMSEDAILYYRLPENVSTIAIPFFKLKDYTIQSPGYYKQDIEKIITQSVVQVFWESGTAKSRS